MSNINRTILTERGVIAVTGDDRKTFLQGLITNNIYKVTQEKALFSALLSPQGKFLYDFFIIEQGDTLLLDIDKISVPDFIRRLTFYKLRSKVAIEEKPDLGVAASWGNLEVEKGESLGIVKKYNDPRHFQLGTRVIFQPSRFFDFPTSSYEHHRLSLGIPEGSKDLTFDRSLPLEWGYDWLHAIDFTKGCYVGQEVTARSKHRATLRKMVHKIEADTTLPPYGSVIMINDKEVGVITSSEGNIGLASLQKEAANAEALLNSNGITIKASLPEWINSITTL